MIVGLTGGIGSGKSTVARAFSERGIPWIDADDVAREIVAPGEPALEAIRQRHGEAVLQSDGTLNRARLRELIFQQPEERTWLESVTHPRVRERIVTHLERMQREDAPYVLLVSPLLFESGQDALVDFTVVIDIPEALQLSRTLARDKVSETQVRAILAAQMPREERRARADALIDNSQDTVHMREQVAKLDEHLRAATR
ncbi:dephospho-CoA kinase [Halomonas llamarensis]|uniref:Dephospho-CoA kinase n=1 Tax=Halomonas llamarensis TaxID=2945104 RepID=A0ABT0SMM4_9GAMM|nr:dephospho-CoA kinase [Halomonas llamarensis]MCL7929052.1 dephospho-CoA kinase [Halomonas llamarensis]